MRLLIIVFFCLQSTGNSVGQENQNKMGWADEAGALVPMMQDHFALGTDKWPNADTFQMVIVGDSIAWGCGLNQTEKYSYLVANWLQGELKRPVEVTVLAHTGATLDTSKSGGHTFIDPELSSWDPTILEQVDKISNPEQVDLILLSGGINDIGVDKILDPTADSNDIINICSSIENSMYNVLIKLLNKCKNAKIIVTSYYPIVSSDTPESALNDFAKVLSSNDPNFLHRAGASLVKDNPITKFTMEEKIGSFVLESIAFNLMRSNSKVFDSSFRRNIGNSEGGAVFDANTYSRAHFGKDRVDFAPVDFPSDKSYGTSGSWLWKLIDTNNGGKTDDHKYADRVSLCDKSVFCNWDDKIDAIGHPNENGSKEYERAIKSALESRVLDWLQKESIVYSKADNEGALISANGAPLERWNKTFGKGSLYSVQHSGNGYVAAGYAYTDRKSGDVVDCNEDPDYYLHCSQDALLIKVDSEGNEIWRKTFGGAESDVAFSVQTTSDGGYILAGKTKGAAWLIKTDPSGNELWNRTFIHPAIESFHSVQPTPDGGCVVASFKSYVGYGPNSDAWLIKIDSAGDVWDKTFDLLYVFS